MRSCTLGGALAVATLAAALLAAPASAAGRRTEQPRPTQAQRGLHGWPMVFEQLNLTWPVGMSVDADGSVRMGEGIDVAAELEAVSARLRAKAGPGGIRMHVLPHTHDDGGLRAPAAAAAGCAGRAVPTWY
jgi:hypothetical protein